MRHCMAPGLAAGVSALNWRRGVISGSHERFVRAPLTPCLLALCTPLMALLPCVRPGSRLPNSSGRPGVAALGSLTRTATPMGSSYSRGAPDHGLLAKSSHYMHGGGGSSHDAATSSASTSASYPGHGGSALGHRDVLQTRRDDTSKRFLYGDVSGPAQRSSSRTADSRKYVPSDSDSDTGSLSPAPAHARQAGRSCDEALAYQAGRRGLGDGASLSRGDDGGRAHTKQPQAHSSLSRRSPSVFDDADETENGTFSMASTRPGERGSSARVRRRGGGEASVCIRAPLADLRE